MSKVARQHPSVLGEDLFGCLLVLIIAQHHAVTLDHDLAVFHLDVHIGHGLAHRAKAVDTGIVCRDQRCALGHTVALEHAHAKLLKGLCDLRAQRSTAHDHAAQLAAEFFKQTLVQRSACVDAQITQYLIELFCKPHLALGSTLGNALLDLLIKDLGDGRHDQNDVGLKSVQVCHNVFQLVVDANGSTAIQHAQVVHRQFKGMVNGQHGHDHGVLQPLAVIHSVNIANIVYDIALAEHNALADARCARGKQDLRHSVGIDLGQGYVLCGKDLGISRACKIDNIANTVIRALNCRRHRCKLARQKYHVHVTHAEKPQHFVRGQHLINGHDHVAAAGNTQKGYYPLIAGRADNGDMPSLPPSID